MLMVRHRTPLIRQGRRGLNLGIVGSKEGAWDVLEPRVMLASKRRLDHLEKNLPDGS